MIQRYGAYGTQAEPEGEFVAYADHATEVARLRAAIELVIERLQMDIEDGERPDQWSMESMVETLRAAVDKGAA
jgi:hypothetical protein